MKYHKITTLILETAVMKAYQPAMGAVRDQKYYGLNPELGETYIHNLMTHINCVYIAGARLRVPEDRLLRHDLSKFDKEEFVPYATWFYGNAEDRGPFNKAFLRHMNRNDHHWGHWIIPGHKPTVVAMPTVAAREMVADWYGASKAYNNTWDISKWLQDEYHLSNIILHDSTRAYVDRVLEWASPLFN